MHNSFTPVFYSLLASLLLGVSSTLATVGPGSKAGLAWPNGDQVSMSQFAGTGRVSWYYTWISEPIRYDANLEFVPMLRDENGIKNWQRDIDKLLKAQRSQPVVAVMGMNEPDHERMANMTPQRAADVWKTYIAPLRQRGLRLGSPATTSARAGKQWMLDWQAACGSDCDYDFLALHHYGWNTTQFMNYITDMQQTFQKPVWVSEWACNDFSVTDRRNCTADSVKDYLNITQTWLDQQDFIERYAWFGAMKNMQNVDPVNALISPDGVGAINPLGLQYINWTGPGLPDSSLNKGRNANRKPNSAVSVEAMSAIFLNILSVAMGLYMTRSSFI